MRAGRQKGTTLLEMIIAIVGVGILATVGAQMLDGGVRAYNETTKAAATLTKMQYAVERLQRELRTMNHNGSAYDISTMQPATAAFTTADGNVVTVTAAPPLLLLDYATPNIDGVLTDQLSAFSLRYYAGDGVTQTNDPTQLAFIEVDLTLTDEGAPYNQRFRIALRDRF